MSDERSDEARRRQAEKALIFAPHAARSSRIAIQWTSPLTPHLRQCSEWLRARNIEPIAAYDTAGSVKNLAAGTDLPKGCTPENTCAIASDLAAETYKCEVRHSSIEDDDSNFTRFLLLSRRGVTKTDCDGVKCKTSVVFTLEETPGALYKALACFSLRDVDFSKIESRPTSPGLLSHLKFKGKRGTGRFRYCFYLDFLSHAEDVNAKNALSHLSECTSFSKVLGSYPSGSGLVGHVSNDLRTRAPVGEGRGKTDFIDGLRPGGAVEGGAVVGKNCEVREARLFMQHRRLLVSLKEKAQYLQRLVASLITPRRSLLTRRG